MASWTLQKRPRLPGLYFRFPDLQVLSSHPGLGQQVGRDKQEAMPRFHSLDHEKTLPRAEDTPRLTREVRALALSGKSLIHARESLSINSYRILGR